MKRIYDESVRLWQESGVERHAEGHPGVPGPSSTDTAYDSDKAYLGGAISTLELIHKRLYEDRARTR